MHLVSFLLLFLDLKTNINKINEFMSVERVMPYSISAVYTNSNCAGL